MEADATKLGGVRRVMPDTLGQWRGEDGEGDEWAGPDVRKAVDAMLRRPLADSPAMEAQCRAEFFKWQRGTKLRWRAGR
jgi:hypothetical protein